MGRKFEKISFEQFCKDINNDKNLYEEYNLPKRHTKYSAGYDFMLFKILYLNQGDKESSNWSKGTDATR